MRYLILGSLEVRDGAHAVPLGQGRQRLLLAVLLLHRGDAVASERLIDLVWGETPPASAASSLHNLVSALRKTLGEGELLTHGHGYALATGELDAAEFADLTTRGRSALAAGDARAAAETLAAALALWRGPALSDLANEEAVSAAAARLEEARLGALEDRINADLALGRHATLVAELAELVERHPARERMRGQQMLALYRSNRQAEALTSYHDYRRRLAAELGLTPAPALRALEQAILEHDGALLAPREPGRRAPSDHEPGRGWRLPAGVAAVALVGLVIAAVALTARGDPPRARASVPVGHDSIAVIDPATDLVVASYPVGATPISVSVGGGAAWAVSADAQTVSRIDLHKRTTRFFATGSVPLELAAGADALWLLAASGAEADGPFAGSPSELTRIDPVSATVVGRTRMTPRDGPGARLPPGLIALAPDAVWTIARNGQLARVDRRDGSTTLSPVADAVFVAAGGGQVWAVTDKRLLRIDPASGRVLARIRVPWASVGSLAVGAGAVWLTDPYAGVVWRIDPGPRPVERTVVVDFGVDGVAADARSVWVSDSVTGRVSRIDPATNRVRAAIALGATPRAVALGAGRVWVAVAGDAGAASSSATAGIAGCGPVLSTPGSTPEHLIVADLPTQGRFSSTVLPMAAAISWVFRRHGFRAGGQQLALQVCDDSSAQSGGQPDPGKCTANARAYAQAPRVLGVIGPVNSYCAQAMLPLLNRAAVPLVSPTNSDVSLVRRAPGAPAGLLRTLYPSGQHGYARIYPSDDSVLAAVALGTQRLGVTRAYFLEPTDGGFPREYFDRAARRIHLGLAGSARWDAGASSFRDLGLRVRASGAQAVIVDGSVYQNVGRVLRDLRRELGAAFPIVMTENALPVGQLFQKAGAAARGVHVVFGGLLPAGLGADGRRFVHAFGATQPGGRVSQFAVYAAAAAEVLLDAIARSDGTRASVVSALGATHLATSPIGPITLDARGEPTIATASMVRAEHAGGAYEVDNVDGSTLEREITLPVPGS